MAFLIEHKYPLQKRGIFIINFQKSTKKVYFVALLKCFFNFVPRGTIVENFFNIDVEEESEKEFVFNC